MCMETYEQMISNPKPDLTSRVSLEKAGLTRRACHIDPVETPADQQAKDTLWKYRWWITGGILAGILLLGGRRS